MIRPRNAGSASTVSGRYRWVGLWLLGALLPAAPAKALDADTPVVISVNAEDLSWTVPIAIASDRNALDGTYVVLPTGHGAGSTSVQLPRAGDYYVWGRVRAAPGAGHAFDLEFGDTRVPWVVAAPTAWHWQRVAGSDRAGATAAAVLSVGKPGAFTFKVLPREAGVSIDVFLITDDPYLAPVDHDHPQI